MCRFSSRNATIMMSYSSIWHLEGFGDGEPDAFPPVSISPFTCTAADQQLNGLREEVLISRSMSGR